MRAYDIIRKKRDGQNLSRDELSHFLSASLKEEIPDYQVAAFLMAVYLRGMTDDETRCLTEVILHSGSVLDLSSLDAPVVDKHSTGGVGDKVSLILTPLVASAGVVVPMLSGRGLGHTGGTLDKLESIPGFKTSLGLQEMKDVLAGVGCVMAGFSTDLAPLDARLYALRDVTATIESIPLITASIMSKKLSEGIEGLVLDVKVGSGAFMKDLNEARKLARAMVTLGNSLHVKTVAVITDMNEPLGRAVGNSLEVMESIAALKGEGPEDLMEVTLRLGSVMLMLAGRVEDLHRGDRLLRKHIDDGSALGKFREMIQAQGGNPAVVEQTHLLPQACVRVDVQAEQEGYLCSMDAEAVGRASMMLGAGRERKEAPIDHAAGILLTRKPGEVVRKGETLCTLCTSDDALVQKAREIFLHALTFGDRPPAQRRMILETVQP